MTFLGQSPLDSAGLTASLGGEEAEARQDQPPFHGHFLAEPGSGPESRTWLSLAVGDRTVGTPGPGVLMEPGGRAQRRHRLICV